MSSPEESPEEIDCIGAVPGGRMLARRDGKIVLVAGALPGERVRVRITKETKSVAEAEVVEVVRAHRGRRAPPCAHAADCGGCNFQYADRDAQVEAKRMIVLDAFRRIAKLDVESILEGPRPVVPEFGARTRIRLSFDPMGRPGLLKRNSHEAIPIEDCPLMVSSFGETVLPWIRLLPPWSKASVRFDSDRNAVLLLESKEGASDREKKRLAKVTKGMDRPDRVRGIVADGIPLGGSRDLAFRLRGMEFLVDAGSFFQGSVEGASELVRTVDALLGDDRDGQLLDVYSGAGLFSVCLGGRFQHVVGSDADEGSVRMLRKNFERNKIAGEARCEEAQVTLRRSKAFSKDTVIVDPPRTGMEKVVRQALLDRKADRLVAVSCDPATGARDVHELVQGGYRLQKLVALDLFPVTAHVETVALLHFGGSES